MTECYWVSGDVSQERPQKRTRVRRGFALAATVFALALAASAALQAQTAGPESPGAIAGSSGAPDAAPATAADAGPAQQAPAAAQQAPAAPKSPSLADLGFAPDQTQGSAKNQALLDRRSHMLKIHQRLGLLTLVPLAATLIASGSAGGRSTSSTGRMVHGALGGLTAGMYITTASFAIFAPKVPGTVTRGPIRLHKALAFVHGAGMILTPILGVMAYHQRNSGQRVHGIASAHGAAAATTGIAYAAAMLSVSLKF
jgi:hypothetical protein